MTILYALNTQQRTAVTLPAESALILAGAGSGKTRVLTTRIAWLIQSGQISAAGILAVTFTNKAAKEMRARLSALLPVPMQARGMWMGTFHGVCHRLLRIHAQEAGLSPLFQILDMQDQLAALKRLLKSFNLSEEQYSSRHLAYLINNAKEQGLRAQAIEIKSDFDRKFVELYAAYDEQCQREGVVDFPELLLRAYELLTRQTILRNHYQARFRHILVDEFQDTNDLQYKWLKLLAGEHNVVFAVGDDDQSIYAFRGANIGNMHAFARDFQGKHLIRLEQNYRSCGHILMCANALITYNTQRLGKELHTEAEVGERVKVFEAMTDVEEAQWLAELCQRLLKEDHHDAVPTKEVAVLYRSNAQSRVIEHALFSAGLSYRVYGGQRFFERAEIKHAMAYLQLIAHPHSDGAFMRVVNFPARGIGAKSMQQLQAIAQASQISFYDAVAHLPGRAGAALQAFTRLIDQCRCDTEHLTLPEKVKGMLNVSGLIAHYQSLPVQKEGADRVENLTQLIHAAELFVQEEEMDLISSLSAFLSHAALEGGELQVASAQERIALMTVHAAKGLEFDTVFITGCEEGLFPHESSLRGHHGLEEERRLMYVAMTRARKQLYMSFSRERRLHGQERCRKRSSFFSELPEEALEWITPPSVSSWHSWFGLPAKTVLKKTISIHEMGRWQIGQSVFHQKFGDGVIVRLERQADSPHAQIDFEHYGVKLLDLGVAKLEVV